MSSTDGAAELSAQFRAAIEEMQGLASDLRQDSAALLEQVRAERDALRRSREKAEQAVAAAARSGAQGSARRELQRRMDLGETTWRDVMSARDRHWSAAEVRAEVVGEARRTIDELEQDDPEFSAAYRAVAPLRRDQEGADQK